MNEPDVGGLEKACGGTAGVACDCPLGRVVPHAADPSIGEF